MITPGPAHVAVPLVGTTIWLVIKSAVVSQFVVSIMVDRPIIFSGAMVRALLDGRKTQTRRLVTSPLRRCEVGDRLYVRESWRVSPEACEGWHLEELRGWIDYQAGGSTEVVAPSFDAVCRAAFLKGEDHDWDFLPSRYRPCIHLPRWASRLTLNVAEVRIEPLRAISGKDAIAEGVERDHGDWKNYCTDGLACLSAHESYATLWNALHATESERWQDNPSVVALTFAVERGNIDGLSGGVARG